MILEALKRILPKWTLFNIIITAISVVSAIIIYLTQTLLPSGPNILQFTIISLLNMIFVIYWSFWIILVAPPVILGLYFSKKNKEYYILAVQNFFALMVLFALKVAFNFNLAPLLG